MFFVIVALFLAARVRSAPTPELEPNNVTVSGPGVSDHGKPNLVCFPTSLMDIAIFVFVNYLTHAASSRIPHGASTRRTVKVVIDSLCYPVLGVGYALDAIAQWSVGLQREFPWIELPKDDLDTAHRAGALITACRDHEWVPHEKDEGYEGVSVTKEEHDSMSSGSGSPSGSEPSPDQQDPPATTYGCQVSDIGLHERKRWLRVKPPNKHFNIFGGRELPKGYSWVFVPWDAKVERPKTNAPPPEKPPPKRRFSIYGGKADLVLPEVPLGAEYSLFQPIAAVVQAISAGITLYRTRGDQLDRYGFTAFGLTVVPYLVMSIVNFFAHFAVPKYSALYIVQSDVLDEATRRNGDDIPRRCVVGRLPSKTPSEGGLQVKVQRETFREGLVTIDIVEPKKTEPQDAEPKNTQSDDNPGNTARGVAEPEIAEPENSESVNKRQHGSSVSTKKLLIPAKPEVGPKDAPEGSNTEHNLKDKAEDKSSGKANVDIEHGIEQVSADEPEPGPPQLPRPHFRITVSRFPSVQPKEDDSGAHQPEDGKPKDGKPKASKRPIGRKTIQALHWAIGLSSLVIIAAISRMQLGTATRPRWKDIFVVWLVFSCLSAVATSMVFGVSGLLLKACLLIVRRVYHFLYRTLDGAWKNCLGWLGGEAKDKKKRLISKAKESDKWWTYADDVIMFILKFAFFFILLVMVSQQLLDYGDCTYFRP
ncbi:hypothetical protein B0T25DRAFT_571469 [Lasiosphaeria hispida]|uniref:Uncharacterized protein n=1 Tax=Lasiosphaeria hispida TaxID=260671 RepID=A0AAJ0HB26_9PEZI|nr:hypothetical protein B0T25DRAFT_571469 [Lasiosphaeria hispida]